MNPFISSSFSKIPQRKNSETQKQNSLTSNEFLFMQDIISKLNQKLKDLEDQQISQRNSLRLKDRQIKEYKKIVSKL